MLVLVSVAASSVAVVVSSVAVVASSVAVASLVSLPSLAVAAGRARRGPRTPPSRNRRSGPPRPRRRHRRRRAGSRRTPRATLGNGVGDLVERGRDGSVELLAHVVAREPPREHGRVCAGLHRLHRLVVFSGRRLEHLVAAGLDRGGNLLDDRAALVDDRGDVAGDAAARTAGGSSRARGPARVRASPRSRRSSPGDVEDRPLCAGRVCLDGGWDRRHRHRETHRVVGGVAIDRSPLRHVRRPRRQRLRDRGP